jgi:hypothetical protein
MEGGRLKSLSPPQKAWGLRGQCIRSRHSLPRGGRSRFREMAPMPGPLRPPEESTEVQSARGGPEIATASRCLKAPEALDCELHPPAGWLSRSLEAWPRPALPFSPTPIGSQTPLASGQTGISQRAQTTRARAANPQVLPSWEKKPRRKFQCPSYLTYEDTGRKNINSCNMYRQV